MSLQTESSTGTNPAPWHLAGNFAPVHEEIDAVDLHVTGELPPGLDGSFLRNGPNPHDGPTPHWFFGDGMIHGLHLAGGRAAWYRNRYVRTSSLTGDVRKISDTGVRNLVASKANTHVVRHAGRILALEEASLPYEVTPDLETVGVYDFAGRLDGPMTAHPKVCPITGEMHFFGYDFQAPYLRYHVADASGQLVVTRDVDVAGPTMMHDFNISERFVIFMDLPMVFDLEKAIAGTMPYAFERDYGARLGVLRRDDPFGVVHWFEIEPCYVFHPLNAHDDGRTITIDVARYAEMWTAAGDDAVMWRWTIDTVAGTVTEQQLDDRPCEFPRVDDRLIGQPAARGWVTTTPDAWDTTNGGSITVYDLANGTGETHQFGAGRVPGEAVFAPADTTPGGPGWLLAYVFDAARGASDVVVLDPNRPADEPVATVHLPVRVPYGFHGSWMPTPG
ncbi:MAG: carotenoid oxygenase family protein [Ilumatobacteraceae bacterium]